jgi:hypothetical protein
LSFAAIEEIPYKLRDTLPKNGAGILPQKTIFAKFVT